MDSSLSWSLAAETPHQASHFNLFTPLGRVWVFFPLRFCLNGAYKQNVQESSFWGFNLASPKNSACCTYIKLTMGSLVASVLQLHCKHSYEGMYSNCNWIKITNYYYFHICHSCKWHWPSDQYVHRRNANISLTWTLVVYAAFPDTHLFKKI